MYDQIKSFVLQLLDESFYTAPVSLSRVVKLTNEFLPESKEHVVEAVIDELIEAGFLAIGFAYGYELGLSSIKRLLATKSICCTCSH